MPFHRRAILAAFHGGLTLFPVHPASAGSLTDFVTRVTDPDELLSLAAVRRAAYHGLIANAEALEVFEAILTARATVLLATCTILLSLALPLVRRWRRGTGELSVRLVFPEEISGEFEIRLHRKSARKGRATGDRGDTPRSRPTRHTRPGVRRETQFDRVGSGTWFLSIDGTLQALASKAKLAHVQEEIQIEIEANACASVEHVMPTVEAPVEFRVYWDRQPARDVGFSLSGHPHTLRYAGQGIIKTRLSPGRHQVVIGAGDRVIEQTVTLSGYDPSLIRIDLAAPEGLIFKGCPPAVTPFLQGDLSHAARALERDGQSEIAALLRARLHQQQGQIERAAEQLESAGRSREAAELRRTISDFERAAALFEKAGEILKAAEMYEAAEAWPAAARAHVRLESWSDAGRCFEAAHDIDGLIGALEGQGEILRAARLAREHGDRARSIRLLQTVGAKDPEYGSAGQLLSLAYENEGHLDLAAQQLERCLAEFPPGEFAPELELHLSELFDRGGDVPEALEVLETLRGRDPTYPGIAARIEALRKKVSGPARPLDTGSFTLPPGATAFVAEDRYEILEEVGRGGMGVIYKARDRRLGRTVALKRMPDSLRDHPAAVQLFLGEAQAAARMNHPNIVTLYDADQMNGHFFITMELLEGLGLNVILKQRTRFGPRDTARLGVQVCAGLQFAHDQGIVHRDIKTSNLYVTRDKVLKIMDFGLAKILEAVRDNGSSVIAGTPFYMAPEQTAGNVSDGRTDLYALGVTLFELSTGRLPFKEGDVAEQHRNAAPPDPRSLIPDYPSDLAELILKLMAKRPEDRPNRADEVAAALVAIIKNS